MQYKDDQLNGYCLFTSFRDDTYPCERIEGYYKDGKLDGWARLGFTDEAYRYGYYVENIMRYVDGELQIPRELVPPQKWIDIKSENENSFFLISENGDGYLYTEYDNDTSQAIEPYFYENGLKKLHWGEGGSFKLYTDGKLMKFDYEHKVYNLVAEDVVDMSSSCYLTAKGRLYNYNQALVMEDVKDFVSLYRQDNDSDNKTIILKKDGSVLQYYIPRDYSSGDSLESFGTPLFIMNDCIAIFGFRDKTFAIKSDHSLWAWETETVFSPYPIMTIIQQPTKWLDHVEEFILGKEYYSTDMGYILFSDHSLVEWSQKNGITKPILKDVATAVINGKGLIILKLDGTVWLYDGKEEKQIADFYKMLPEEAYYDGTLE